MGLLPDTGYLIELPDGTEVSKDADAEGNISIEDDWFGGTITIVRKGDGVNTEDSDPQNLVLAACPAAPSLGKSDETIKGKKDGTVTGLTAAMEYSADGGRTWTAAVGDLTDVPAGKYLVRLSATQTAPYGKTSEAVVGEGRTLTVTFDSQGGSSVSPVAGLTWRAAVAKPADPTKADVVFAGWFKEASCANRWHFAAEEVSLPLRRTVPCRWTESGLVKRFRLLREETGRIRETAIPSCCPCRTVRRGRGR